MIHTLGICVQTLPCHTSTSISRLRGSQRIGWVYGTYSTPRGALALSQVATVLSVASTARMALTESARPARGLLA